MGTTWRKRGYYFIKKNGFPMKIESIWYDEGLSCLLFTMNAAAPKRDAPAADQ
jgi:hypothetical protein